MHLEAALRKAGLQLGHHGFCFSPAPTVDEAIIRIPTPREVGMRPFHPEIEGIVQEEIGKYRADHAPYAKDNFRFERALTGWRGGVVVDLRRKG